MEPSDCTTVNKEEETCAYAMQLASSSVLPMVLKAAVELKVFDIIAEAGPEAKLSTSEIASRLPNTCNQSAPEMLDRMMRLLASNLILTCSEFSSDQPPLGQRRLYGLAPVAKYFVPDQDGVSVGPLLFMLQDKVLMDSWDGLKGAVVEGGNPFDKVHGMPAFEYAGKDPMFNKVFNKAMTNHTIIVLNKILQSSYKGFEQVEKLVDVGGGLGVTLNLIASKYPHIKGVNFDLPHVIQHAPPYPGVEHVGGDMFESVPKGDAIFMKAILHNWSDDHCLKLLKNCHKALPDNGKIIVVEGILPANPDTNVATKCIFQRDLIMLSQCPGGKERTKKEFMTLAAGAGFSGIRLECFAFNFWVMEFYK